jgi:hypothetical protein
MRRAATSVCADARLSPAARRTAHLAEHSGRAHVAEDGVRIDLVLLDVEREFASLHGEERVGRIALAGRCTRRPRRTRARGRRRRP